MLVLGRNSKNLTVSNSLFLNNRTIVYWKFQSTYVVTMSKGVATGASAIQFVINSPPSNGTCTIDKNNGTTTTLFQVTCANWVDSDGINDYAFYGNCCSSVGVLEWFDLTFALCSQHPPRRMRVELPSVLRRQLNFQCTFQWEIQRPASPSK